MARFFSLEQARELLPRVQGLIEQAIESKAQYRVSEDWTHSFVRRVMMAGGVLVDRAPFERNRDAQMRSAARLKASVEAIQDLGVLIKDLDTGLVDFPTLFRGSEVYLCWKLGEDDVEFWHGVNEGFAGRKSIDSDFIENHRGRAGD